MSFPSRGASPQPCLTLCFLEALLQKKKNSTKENKPEVLLTRSLQLTSYNCKHIISSLSLNPHESPTGESTTPIIKIIAQGPSRVMGDPSSKKAVLDQRQNQKSSSPEGRVPLQMPDPLPHLPNPIPAQGSLGLAWAGPLAQLGCLTSCLGSPEG